MAFLPAHVCVVGNALCVYGGCAEGRVCPEVVAGDATGGGGGHAQPIVALTLHLFKK